MARACPRATDCPFVIWTYSKRALGDLRFMSYVTMREVVCESGFGLAVGKWLWAMRHARLSQQLFDGRRLEGEA